MEVWCVGSRHVVGRAGGEGTPDCRPASHHRSTLQHRLAGSPAASADHPYLRRKCISADGLRTDRRGRLRVPMVDFDGHIGSLQTIDGQGRKRFSKGSCVTGLHLLLGSLTPGATLLIAKGYATFRPVVVQYRAAIPKPWYHSLHWLQVSFRIMLGNGTYRA
jgi:hypothetical protein